MDNKVRKCRVMRTCGHMTKVIFTEREADAALKKYRSTPCDDCLRKRNAMSELSPRRFGQLIPHFISEDVPEMTQAQAAHLRHSIDKLKIKDLYDE